MAVYSRTVPCQNVLDYFKTVLDFHNQLVQPMTEEQFAEVRKPHHFSQLFKLNCLLSVLT